MRLLKYIFLSAVLAGPCVLIAQESAPGTGASGTGNSGGNPTYASSEAEPDQNVQVFYEGNVKITVKTVNGVTVITYDSSALQTGKPDQDKQYMEDVEDVYKKILELEKKKERSLMNVGPGDWKLVVEGPIIGAQPQPAGTEGYGMTPPLEYLKVNTNATVAPNRQNNTDGLMNPSLSDAVQIYPNPAQSYLKVNLKNDEVAQIRILSMNGQEVYTVPGMQQYNSTIDLNSLTDGVYLLEVVSNGERTIKKFAKY